MRKKTFYFSQLAPLHWKEKRGSRGLGRENEHKADVLTCLGACSRNVRLDRDNWGETSLTPRSCVLCIWGGWQPGLCARGVCRALAWNLHGQARERAHTHTHTLSKSHHSRRYSCITARISWFLWTHGSWSSEKEIACVDFILYWPHALLVCQAFRNSCGF